MMVKSMIVSREVTRTPSDETAGRRKGDLGEAEDVMGVMRGEKPGAFIKLAEMQYV